MKSLCTLILFIQASFFESLAVTFPFLEPNPLCRPLLFCILSFLILPLELVFGTFSWINPLFMRLLISAFVMPSLISSSLVSSNHTFFVEHPRISAASLF